MDYPAYRFRSLEKFTRDDAACVNRACDYFESSERVTDVLKAVSETLSSFEICSEADLEIALHVKHENGNSQIVRMNQARISIGRIQENDLVLKSPLVSKKHAEISRRGSEFFIKDLTSNNGTYLNQVRLQPGSEVLLKNEDLIKIDPFDLGVEFSSDAGKRALDILIAGISRGGKPAAQNLAGVFLESWPGQDSVLLIIDQESAGWMISKIMTGQTETSRGPWTEIEHGVLEFLVAEILAAVNALSGTSRFLLEKVATDSSVLEEWFVRGSDWVRVSFTVRSENGPISAFLFVPGSLLSPSGHSNPLSLLERAPWIRSLSYVFSASVGTTHLSPDQVATLDKGDILLLDQTDVILENHIPHGKIFFHCDQLKRGIIRGSLICDGTGKSTITVEALDQEGLKHMTDANKKVDAAQGTSSPGIVSGIEIPVTVEFARLSFTLEELSSMKEGQIVEIEKAQPELVDLSVEGKVVASGKLVDVEGKLGVRVLKVLKSKS